jgi:uncharacterized Zn-finger protein
MMSQNPKYSPEIIKVDNDVDEVVCDGGGGPMGHPQVWYGFDGCAEVSCHYCGRKFIKKPD